MEMWRVVALVACVACGVTCEVFTSSQDLAGVFALERRVVGALNSYLHAMDSRLAKIRSYLQQYEQVAGEEGTATEDGVLERLAGNPVHAFHLMKRLTVDWRHIRSQVEAEDLWQGVLSSMGEGVGVRLPKEEDLHGAAQALVRLHDVYNLNMTELVRGTVWGVQSNAELTAQDCLYMGKHSFNLGLYPRAIQWFEEAYVLAGMEGNTTVNQDQVNLFLNTAIKAHDEQTAAKDDENINTDPQTNQGNTHNKENEEKENKRERRERREMRENTEELHSPATYRLGNNTTPHDDSVNFQALCRGEKLLSAEYEATLTCYLETRRDPYLTLMPARVERHHHHPELLTFHDVVSDNEIQAIKALARPMLARAMVQGMQGKGNTVSQTRTSKVGWLDDTLHPVVARLGRRVAAVTGLNTDVLTDAAELLQVANYGIGGHYNPHHDYLLVDKTEHELRHNIHPRELVMGDRIATFMFYLSDVTRGGATAFPRLGTAVWPRKGSAAFWYNLRRSGQGDTLTLHGACPVVHGYKWVSNKWIRERGQFATRRCGLSPEE